MSNINYNTAEKVKEVELTKEEVIDIVKASSGDDWLYYDDNNIIYKPDLLIKISDSSLMYGVIHYLNIVISKQFFGNYVNLQIVSESEKLDINLQEVLIIEDDDHLEIDGLQPTPTVYA